MAERDRLLPERQEDHPATQYTETITGETTRALGGLIAAVDPLAGAAVVASSGVLATAAGRATAFFTEWKARRVEQTCTEARKILDEKGVAPDPVTLGDLLSETQAVITDAETEEKRRFLAAILVGSVVCPTNRIGAPYAMELIGSLPSAAVGYLGRACQILLQYCGDPKRWAAWEVQGVQGCSFYLGEEWKILGLPVRLEIEATKALGEANLFFSDEEGWFLGETGTWLCGWLIEHGGIGPIQEPDWVQHTLENEERDDLNRIAAVLKGSDGRSLWAWNSLVLQAFLISHKDDIPFRFWNGDFKWHPVVRAIALRLSLEPQRPVPEGSVHEGSPAATSP